MSCLIPGLLNPFSLAFEVLDVLGSDDDESLNSASSGITSLYITCSRSCDVRAKNFLLQLLLMRGKRHALAEI